MLQKSLFIYDNILFQLQLHLLMEVRITPGSHNEMSENHVRLLIDFLGTKTLRQAGLIVPKVVFDLYLHFIPRRLLGKEILYTGYFSIELLVQAFGDLLDPRDILLG